MEAIAREGVVEIAAIADPFDDLVHAAHAYAPDASTSENLEGLLCENLDGVVIATPNALHAEQSIRALEAGLAVFCQKPLGRTAEETRRVVDTARRADRLLGVDLSYRFVEGIQKLRQMVLAGEIGDVFAANLVFHNAYGPDKPWFYDPKLSGGGCLIDLGVHLVDLALSTLGSSEVVDVSGRLFAHGVLLAGQSDRVEDYATARIDLANGVAVDLACSWNLSAGCDCVIEATFYGTRGALSLRNLNGSFYDFVTEHFQGTSRRVIAAPPDEWGGRAAVAWARQLAESSRYDPAIEEVVTVARVLDWIYDC